MATLANGGRITEGKRDGGNPPARLIGAVQEAAADNNTVCLREFVAAEVLETIDIRPDFIRGSHPRVCHREVLQTRGAASSTSAAPSSASWTVTACG